MVGICLTDFKDQRAIVRDELWFMKEELKQLKVEKGRLQAFGLAQRSGHDGPVAFTVLQVCCYPKV